MKKLLVILAVLIALPISISYAQSDGTTVFGGFRVDDGLLLSGGVSVHLGAGLYLFEYVDVGDYSSLNSELAYLFTVPTVPKLRLGLLAGPDSDWIGEHNDGFAPTFYWSGAGGGIAVYRFTDKFGAWAFGKYKFALDDDAKFYPEGSIFGAGVFIGL